MSILIGMLVGTVVGLIILWRRDEDYYGDWDE